MFQYCLLHILRQACVEIDISVVLDKIFILVGLFFFVSVITAVSFLFSFFQLYLLKFFYSNCHTMSEILMFYLVINVFIILTCLSS